jgi:hypothetical protein
MHRLHCLTEIKKRRQSQQHVETEAKNVRRQASEGWSESHPIKKLWSWFPALLN